MKRALPFFALLMLSRFAHADDQAHETRQLPAFQAVDVAGTLKIEVQVGKAASFELEGDRELFSKVTTTVKNGVLIIDTKFPRNASVNHHLKVVLGAPQLTSVSITGTASMKLEGVANSAFAINIPGTGEIKASGATGALRVAVDGTGSISAKDLQAKSVSVDVSGTGSATVNASDSVDASVSGTGSIRVHGNPARVRKSVTGIGSVHVRA